jgi:hypothetical protein
MEPLFREALMTGRWLAAKSGLQLDQTNPIIGCGGNGHSVGSSVHNACEEEKRAMRNPDGQPLGQARSTEDGGVRLTDAAGFTGGVLGPEQLAAAH